MSAPSRVRVDEHLDPRRRRFAGSRELPEADDRPTVLRDPVLAKIGRWHVEQEAFHLHPRARRLSRALLGLAESRDLIDAVEHVCRRSREIEGSHRHERAQR